MNFIHKKPRFCGNRNEASAPTAIKKLGAGISYHLFLHPSSQENGMIKRFFEFLGTLSEYEAKSILETICGCAVGIVAIIAIVTFLIVVVVCVR